MDEESFTKLFSVKIICLTLTFAFIVVPYAFSTFARENIEYQPSNDQVKEKRVSPEAKYSSIRTNETKLDSTTKKVEEVSSHSAPDRSAGVMVSAAVLEKNQSHFILLSLRLQAGMKWIQPLSRRSLWLNPGTTPGLFPGRVQRGLCS